MADDRTGMRITGIEIPFMALMSLMVKASFAAIPAAIIIAIAWVMVIGLVGSMGRP